MADLGGFVRFEAWELGLWAFIRLLKGRAESRILDEIEGLVLRMYRSVSPW